MLQPPLTENLLNEKERLNKRKTENQIDISKEQKLSKDAKLFKKRMMDNWSANIEPSYKNAK